jgi:hypothetical protein
MNKPLLALVAVAAGCGGSSTMREGTEATAPRGATTFLGQLEGEWEYEAEAMTGPGQPAQRLEGVERGRMIGPWAVLETDGETPNGRFVGILTVGPGAADKQYVATWISSVQDMLVQYEGRLDEAGRVLTLETTGPDPSDPAKQTRYRDVIELDGDRKEVASMMEVDGKWITYLRSHSRRRR